MQWNYPVYVIPHGGGFASVVDAETGDAPIVALAVFTKEETAAHFMQICSLGGGPRPLTNAHQFAWLLQSLREPVSRVAFDPVPDQPNLSAEWIVPIDQLLSHKLLADRSPWNYPVFVVMHATGFASIAGDDEDHLTAVCLFTNRENAEQYLEASGNEGEVFPIEDRKTIREFLDKIAPGAGAIALDPVIRDGRHTAEYCVSIAALVDKYL